MKNEKKRRKTGTLLKLGVLVCYILCAGVLVAESMMPGKTSSDHSDTVGNIIDNATRVDKIIEPESISVFGENGGKLPATVNVGDSLRPEVAVFPINATYQQFRVESAGGAAVEVAPDGTLTFLSEGRAEITFVSERNLNIKTQVNFKVAAVKADDINIVNLPTICYAGDSFSLSAEVLPVNATQKSVTFRTDSAEASITPEGELTLLKAGIAKIVAVNADGFEKTFSVKTEPRPVTKVDILLSGLPLREIKYPVGSSFTLSADVKPLNAADRRIVWDLDGDDIAALKRGERDAEVAFYRVGTAILTATSPDGPSASVKLISEKIPLEELKISSNGRPADSIFLYEGDALELTAVAKPLFTTDTALVWRVVGDAVDLAPNGPSALLTARRAGTAKVIVAAAGNTAVSASVTVTVQAIKLTGLTLKRPDCVHVGKTARLDTILFTIPSERAYPRQPVFVSNNPEVVGVDAVTGVVTGLSRGSAVVTAILDGLSDSVTVVCEEEKELREICLGETEKTLLPRQSYKVSYTLLPADTAYREVRFKSSDVSVVSVSGNTIRALKKGFAIITAYSPYYSESGPTADLEVTVDPRVDGFKLQIENTAIFAGAGSAFKVVTNPGGLEIKEDIDYEISDTDIIRVSGGRLLALKTGKAEIKAIYRGLLFETKNTDTPPVIVNVKSGQDADYVPLSGLRVTKDGQTVDALTLALDEEIVLETRFSPSNASVKSCVYDVSSSCLALQVQNGVLTLKAEAVGKAAVTILSEDTSALRVTFNVEVVCLTPRGIKVIGGEDGKLLLSVGESARLDYAYVGEALPDDAFWSYDMVKGAEIALTEDGKSLVVTGFKECKLEVEIIYRPDKRIRDKLIISVAAVAVDLVETESDSLVLKIGDSAQVEARALNKSGKTPTNSDLIWTVPDGACVAVDDGLVKALFKGDTVVRAASAAYAWIYSEINIRVIIVDAESVEVSSPPPVIYAGDTFELSAYTLPADCTYKTLSYSVSDGSKAAVGIDGIVVVKSPGSFEITVSSLYNETSANAARNLRITALPVVATDISLSGYDKLYVGRTARFSAELSGDDGRRPTNEKVVFAVSDPGAAGIDAGGLLSVYKKGNITVSVVWADDPSVAAEIDVVLLDVPAESLKAYFADGNTFKIGDSAELFVTLSPRDVTVKELLFFSSNSNVAAVDASGRIRAKSRGACEISVAWAQDPSLKAVVAVKVENITGISALTFRGIEGYSDGKGQITQNASARIVPYFIKGATYKAVLYSSSNSEVLEIDKAGVITALKPGLAVITVTYYDGDPAGEPYTLSLELTVNRQKLSDLVDNWAYAIRKSIGHFGAFLILGVFCALSFLFFVKRRFAGGALTLLSGFGVAAFTELIQYFTPARGPSFNDVLLDFTGFCFSAVVIIAAAAAVRLVKYVKRKKKKNSRREKH